MANQWKQVPQAHCFLESGIPGPIKIRMEHKVNTGGQVWNGALALTSYFESIGYPEMLRGAAPLRGPLISAKRAAAANGGPPFVETPPTRPSPYRVLELGAGTGYVGLWMAHHGADVLLTDLAVQMSTLRSNLYINLASHSANGIDLTARADQFEWGAPRIGPIDDDDDDVTNTTDTRSATSEPSTAIASVDTVTPHSSSSSLPWDIVICSDVLYAVAAHHLLVHSLDWLTSEHTTIWVSYQHRRKEESTFFDMIRDLGFVSEQVYARGNASSLEEHDPYITIHRLTRTRAAAMTPTAISCRNTLNGTIDRHRCEQQTNKRDEQAAREQQRKHSHAANHHSHNHSHNNHNIITVTTATPPSKQSLTAVTNSSVIATSSSSSSVRVAEDIEEPDDTSFRPEGDDFLDFL